MNKQVLSIEQMKHLYELGIDTSKASCSYDIHKATNSSTLLWGFEEDSNDVMFETIPTFTLQDILELLPDSIYSKFEYQILDLSIEKLGKEWSVSYKNLIDHKDFNGSQLIDVAYKMLCWCIENNYGELIKK